MKPSKLLLFLLIEVLTTSAIGLVSYWAIGVFHITGEDAVEKTLIIIPIAVWFIQLFIVLSYAKLIPKNAVKWQDRYL